MSAAILLLGSSLADPRLPPPRRTEEYLAAAVAAVLLVGLTAGLVLVLGTLP